jgi:hypothetical protein
MIILILFIYPFLVGLRNTITNNFQGRKKRYVSVWKWIQRFEEYPIYKRSNPIQSSFHCINKSDKIKYTDCIFISNDSFHQNLIHSIIHSVG